MIAEFTDQVYQSGSIPFEVCNDRQEIGQVHLHPSPSPAGPAVEVGPGSPGYSLRRSSRSPLSLFSKATPRGAHVQSLASVRSLPIPRARSRRGLSEVEADNQESKDLR
jgi:hypothetical protein